MSAWLSDPKLVSALIVAGATAVALLLQHLSKGLQSGRYGWQRRLRAWLGAEEGQPFRELGWLVLVLQVLLWLGVAVALLRVWELGELSESLLEVLRTGGFAIGSVTIVPAKLFTGLVWFLLLLFVLRWARRRMETRWLRRTPMEAATRELVATLFGYTGFAVALLVGLGMAGVDFTKLAIVAGGLSVGIGFGLREIANNFISGLILLFEQPVRKGDYIFVQGTEGFVRKIRIRATEIEDWNRESIVVPNSAILQNHVRNLNLRDDYGRIIVPVGVAYGSDTALVREALIEAAQGHRETIKDQDIPGVPGPLVIFRDFGDSALVFELRVFVRDVTRRIVVASELRFAIDALFRARGITIPFPQRDVWMRTPEGGLGETVLPPDAGNTPHP